MEQGAGVPGVGGLAVPVQEEVPALGEPVGDQTGAGELRRLGQHAGQRQGGPRCRLRQHLVPDVRAVHRDLTLPVPVEAAVAVLVPEHRGGAHVHPQRPAQLPPDAGLRRGQDRQHSRGQHRRGDEEQKDLRTGFHSGHFLSEWRVSWKCNKSKFPNK